MATTVSTYAVSNATRLSILKMQSELAVRQKEVATGRLDDVGLALGGRAGQTVSLRQEHARLQSIIDSNSIVTARLDATQAGLGSILEGAEAFLGALIDARGGSGGPGMVEERAKAELASLINGLNATQNGEYLFSGINTDVRPVTDYFAEPAAANKQAVDAAFLAAFGVAQTDPAAADIDAADLKAFLEGDFADLFEGAQWSTAWSSASDQTIRSRISTVELIGSSATAQNAAVQKLAMTYTMMADLGAAGLKREAYEALIDTAVSTMGEAIKGITDTRAQLGSSQSRVATASERMAIQMDVLATHIDTLEGVDPYEASTRVNALLTQIETAYALTARIQQLSLLDYL